MKIAWQGVGHRRRLVLIIHAAEPVRTALQSQVMATLRLCPQQILYGRCQQKRWPVIRAVRLRTTFPQVVVDVYTPRCHLGWNIVRDDPGAIDVQNLFDRDVSKTTEMFPRDHGWLAETGDALDNTGFHATHA